jgi:hypothetical protein
MGKEKTKLKGSTSELVLKALLRPDARKALSKDGRWSSWVDEVNSAKGHWRGVAEGLQIIDQELAYRSRSRSKDPSAGKKRRPSSAPAYGKSKLDPAVAAQKAANLARVEAMTRPCSTYNAHFTDSKVPKPSQCYDSINVCLDGKSPLGISAKHPSVLRFLSIQEVEQVKDVLSPKAMAAIEKWRVAEMDESRRLSVMRALRAVVGVVRGNSKAFPRSVSHQDLSWPDMRLSKAATIKPSDKKPSRIPVGNVSSPDPFLRVESHRSLRRAPNPPKDRNSSSGILRDESHMADDRVLVPPRGAQADDQAKAKSRRRLSRNQSSIKECPKSMKKDLSLRRVLVDGRFRDMDTSYRAPGADNANHAEYAASDATHSEYLPLRIMPAQTMSVNVSMEMPGESGREVQTTRRQRPKSAPSGGRERESSTNVAGGKHAHAQAHSRRLIEVTAMVDELERHEAQKVKVSSQSEPECTTTEPKPVSLICHHNAASQESELVLNNIPLDKAAFYMNSTYQKEYNGGDRLVPD